MERDPPAREQAGSQQIVLFDGVCNFCNGVVTFILARDKHRRFKFAPLQSRAAAEILQRFQIPSDSRDSVVLVDRGRCYTRSTAVLHIFRQLRGLWPLLYVFVLIPRALRDSLYDAFIKRRYRWFGKQDTCVVPSPEIRDRFIA